VGGSYLAPLPVTLDFTWARWRRGMTGLAVTAWPFLFEARPPSWDKVLVHGGRAVGSSGNQLAR